MDAARSRGDYYNIDYMTMRLFVTPKGAPRGAPPTIVHAEREPPAAAG
jgi:hypothetical protein